MRTTLEEDFKKIGMDIGGEEFTSMAYCMPKSDGSFVINDVIKIKEVTRVSINPGDMLVVHIDTEGLPSNCLSESVIGRISNDLKKFYGKDIKVMICDERTRVEVVKKNSKRKREYRKREYRKTKIEMGIWKS
jgi:hypothetical protein